LAIGTVTTGAEGSSADATISGTAPSQTLSLVIPVGATGAVGATGPQGPAGTATTSASDLTSGTLADARLSGNVALEDVANTFTQNQTLNGTNNVAPNQTAASGSSIMTRDLVDARCLNLLRTSYLNFNSATSLTASGGASSASRGAWQIFTSTTANSRAAAYFSWFYVVGTNTSQIDFGNRFIFIFNRSATTPRAGLVQYVQIGRTINSSTVAKLDKKGFGIEFANAGVTAYVHNGTSVTNGTQFAHDNTRVRWMLDFVPGVALYVYAQTVAGAAPTLVDTISTGLPSGSSTVSDDQIEFVQGDDGSGGANFWSYYNTAFILHP
jgi:hypothetical protein